MKTQLSFIRACASTLIALSVIVYLGLLSPAVAGSANRPASGIAPTGNLRSDRAVSLDAGMDRTLDLRGWQGTFDPPHGLVLSHAQVEPATPQYTWSALANKGLNAWVRDLAMINGDLFVGGYFNKSADGTIPLNHVARFSGGAWSALPHSGLNDFVESLAVVGNDLYVGGFFTQTSDGGVPLNHIAKFSNGTWSALPNNGLNGDVYAIALSGNDLYVGGEFTQTADGTVKNLNHIARFSGGIWTALPNNGLSNDTLGRVFAIAPWGNILYVGGQFTRTFDGTVKNLTNIARFDGSSWSALPHKGLNNTVNSLAVIGSDLYVGGNFTQTFDGKLNNLNHIAKFGGGAWSALPNDGLSGGAFSTVSALAELGSNVFVGGEFTQTTDAVAKQLNNIAILNGGVWLPLPNNGLNRTVFAITVSGTDLFVGGWFTASADGSVTNLNYIAKLSGGCSTKPAKPTPTAPNNGLVLGNLRPVLKWSTVSCATTYTVIVKNALTGQTVDKATGLTNTKYRTDPLASATSYKWFAKACNTYGCTKSVKQTFTTP